MGRKRRIPPFEMEVTGLGKGGTGTGLTPHGELMRVKAAPPGARVRVVPFGRKKAVWQGRRAAMIRPPAAFAEPPCPVFGLCGGCALQELSLDAQREAKQRMALAQIGGSEATVHPVRGAEAAYRYRNKVELSFGPRRYLSEADLEAGLPIDGRFMGFHAPGRFDRVVDTDQCWLVSEEANALLRVVRAHALCDDAPAPYDVREHTGFWRHLVLREGFGTGELLVVLYTASGDGEPVERVARALMAADLGDKRLVGVIWAENGGLADVARGEVRRVWGRDHLFERLGDVTFRLGATSFFQTSTRGAEILYDTVGEALGDAGGTLFDLYCGIGTIGQYLADRFDAVVGIEEVEEAVEDARANAARNGVQARYEAARVENALASLSHDGRRTLVVDPPRPGLHPKVAKALARADADVLVYVACNPASLGRDAAILAEGGWRLTDLWTVDLFPQTGHVEVVGRLVREETG